MLDNSRIEGFLCNHEDSLIAEITAILGLTSVSKTTIERINNNGNVAYYNPLNPDDGAIILDDNEVLSINDDLVLIVTEIRGIWRPRPFFDKKTQITYMSHSLFVDSSDLPPMLRRLLNGRHLAVTLRYIGEDIPTHETHVHVGAILLQLNSRTEFIGHNGPSVSYRGRILQYEKRLFAKINL